MNELTDEQIENIYLDHRDQLPNIPLIRAIITADRAQRQAEQEPAAAIAALERIAGDLQTLCDKQALMLGELEAQLEAVGADCESWYKQNQQSIDDANKFGGERDSAWAEVERLKADALRAAVAPDGWVLVPLEPTAEMLQAGQDTPVSESDEDAPEDYKAVYRAMLAAAPHPQQIAGLDKDAEIERLKDALTFVERWANHHAQKPHVTAAEALSCIQHYPEIEAITESYADGKVPETRDPYAEIAALQQEVDNALALWSVAHAERSEAMIHGARLEAEIIALKAEQNDLRIKIAIIRQDSNREFEDYRIERDQLRVALLDIARLKTEGDALRKDAERYRFVVSSTDHSVAKWHDCEGWYAIDEADLDADMQAQAVKP